MGKLDNINLGQDELKRIESIKDKDTKILLITSNILELADIAKNIYINLHKEELGFECFVYKPDGYWKIEDLRKAFSESNKFKSLGCKIIVIEEIDSMDARAVPVALKYLEEVGPTSKYILTARSANLASVILSRVEEILTIKSTDKVSLNAYYKDLMINEDDGKWLFDYKVPFVLFGADKKNNEIINYLRVSINELDNKKIDIINKIEKIFKSLESIVKMDKKNEKTLLYWYNNVLRERSLRLLYQSDSKKGFEKIEIINQHEASLIYNPNIELYIYTLFLKLYR
jgi:hypothetical protein